jgi:hypothetical protein
MNPLQSDFLNVRRVLSGAGISPDNVSITGRGGETAIAVACFPSQKTRAMVALETISIKLPVIIEVRKQDPDDDFRFNFDDEKKAS